MTKWLYQARVVPMGKPILFPDNHGRPMTFTFDKVNFSQSRRNVDAGDIPILLAHDPKLEVGKLRSLTPNREWWICSFELREDVIREPFEVGQNVSVGLGWTDGYACSPQVSEVSIVRHGRVPGAEITHRMPMPVRPSARERARTATKRPEPAGDVIYGGDPLIQSATECSECADVRANETARGSRGHEPLVRVQETVPPRPLAAMAVH